MVVVYDSMTGSTKKAAEKLGYPTINIKHYSDSDDPVVFLMTRSFGFGEIPKTTQTFLSFFANRVIGVAVSGNKNWGVNYGKAGATIEKMYNIPLVLKFEGIGFPSDIIALKKFLKQHEN